MAQSRPTRLSVAEALKFERIFTPRCQIEEPGAASLIMQTTTAPRFNQLVEQYYPMLFHFAASLCGSTEAALALTQRTFRRAHERNAKTTAPANVKQWLFTMLFLEFLEHRQGHAADDGAVAFF